MTVDKSEVVPWWHFLHQWTRWKTVTLTTSDPIARHPRIQRQRRECVRCGHEQFRKSI